MPVAVERIGNEMSIISKIVETVVTAPVKVATEVVVAVLKAPEQIMEAADEDE